MTTPDQPSTQAPTPQAPTHGPGPIPARTLDDVRDTVWERLAALPTPPLPGSGGTLQRWRALEDECARDPDVGRLLEAHRDADAILAELTGGRVGPGELWGVWAAEPPLPELRAVATGSGVVLEGTKPWCSGATLCTHALVTARSEEGRRLYRVDLAAHAGSLATSAGEWVWPGMIGTDTERVRFDSVPADPVGGPRDYLDRPGFWHGGIGVAACWLGTATRTLRPLLDRCARPAPSDLDLAALGAVDAAIAGARWALAGAASEIDAAAAVSGIDAAENDTAGSDTIQIDTIDAARLRARRVRAVVESAVETVLNEVSSATGAGPLAHGATHAQAVADTMAYVRQSHGRKDLAGLGAESDLRAPGASSLGPSDPGPGTPEEHWARWFAGRRTPELDLPRGPVLVVAPHPDDEALGCGPLVAELALAGRPPELVVVTDGAASHPGSPTVAPADLVRLRRAESEASAAALGTAPPTFLDVPDGAVAAHSGGVIAALETALRRLGPGATLVGPCSGDGHPDHEAVAAACREAADRTGATLLGYPVWLWHHREPGDPGVPWDRLRAHPASAEARAAADAAIRCFRTQIAPLSDADVDAPVVPAHVLAHLTRPVGYYFA